MDDDPARLRPCSDASKGLKAALFEIKRVIVGQDAMLERVLVALLAGGHLLLEGVPGLAKTLTIKTRRRRPGRDLPARSSSRPTWCPPTWSARASTGPTAARSTPSSGRSSATSCSPTRSTARRPRSSRRCSRSCRSARSRSAGETFTVPDPFLVMATQNPIESEGTYPLPEAQVDRFMLKVAGRLPRRDEEIGGRRTARSAPAADRDGDARSTTCASYSARRARSTSTASRRRLRGRARRRHAPARRVGLRRARALHRSTAPARAARSTSCTPRARSRCFAAAATSCPQDVRDARHDVLRHRIVLSYEALAEGVDADLIARPACSPPSRCRASTSRDGARPRDGVPARSARRRARPARPGPGADAATRCCARST